MYNIHPACADVGIVDGEVQVVPRRKKVAIVGFATNTLHLVPWTNPEFEIWGMNQGYMHMKRRADRHFEMHMPEATADVRDPDYLDFLKYGRITWKAEGKPDEVQTISPMIPIYMIQHYDEYPTSIRYPIEEAIRIAGRDYFTSSVAFMLALAVMEGFQEVHIYGVNLAIGDEWSYERPNAEWWIGKLEGMGIKVYVPSASSLLKQFRRYGYSIDARPSASLKQLLNARIMDYRSRIERAQADIHTMIGAMRESEALVQIAEGVDHGADIVLVPPTGELGT